MSRQAPREIADLAIERAAAREARDWATADRLKVRIEAAGWSVVDRGTRYTLRPAHLPDVEDGGVVRYGHSLAVPSRWAEPVGARATVVLVADDRPAAIGGVLEALAARPEAADELQVVVVADDPTPGQSAALTAFPAMGSDSERGGADADRWGAAGMLPEVVWTSARLGRPVALNAGLRRAVGSVVIVVGAGGEWGPDVAARLVRILDDPSVAIAGLRGLATADLRRFRDVGAGLATVVTGTIAFRREDLLARGPLEERFLTARGLDVWWSLTLRDAAGTGPLRTAAVVPGLIGPEVVGAERPDGRRPDESPLSAPPDEASRPVRRDFYRLRDAFGGRQDFLAAEAPDVAPPID